MPKWIVTDAQPIAKALGAAGNGTWNGMTMADGAGPGGSLT